MLMAASAVLADEVVDRLAERIGAAPLIVEGEAGRGYVSWDGADPASIGTFTPLVITRVLKGALREDHVLLRQPGGETGGASRAEPLAAQFEPGERVIVFLGRRDPGDGSYDIDGGALGTYRVVPDAHGVPVAAVRLGVDVATYSSREKAPGTLLGQVTVETFAQLAAGAPAGRPVSAPNGARPAAGGAPPRVPGQTPQAPARDRDLHKFAVIALAASLGASVIAWRLMRRRSTR